jgi:hypothetical protein
MTFIKHELSSVPELLPISVVSAIASNKRFKNGRRFSHGVEITKICWKIRSLRMQKFYYYYLVFKTI